MKQVIYETSGRAREYNELAINLYTGCSHNCLYCYGSDVIHMDKNIFHQNPKPRLLPSEISAGIEHYALTNPKDRRRVLLCFITDPYQPIESQYYLTQCAIKNLHLYGFGVHILTKAGKLAQRDFGLLSNKDAFATTLTCLDDKESRKWESEAGLPKERMDNLSIAHYKGIETWVSLEPVLNPEWTMEIVRLTNSFVNHYKVGKLNYHPDASKINWRKFGYDMKSLLDKSNARYYFKKDLLREMGLTPETFKQTWVCK